MQGGLFGGDNEFGNILQEAVKIKGAQMNQKRKQYEVWPYFVQHTLFHGEKDDFKAWRRLPYDQKMEQAQKLKKTGNDLFSERNFTDAVDRYEEAGGLFYYCYSSDPEWRKNNRGIDDDVLHLVDDLKEGSEELSASEQAEIKKLRLTCCLNLGACKIKLSKWEEAIKACDMALELEPDNVKALYRRAEARVKPGKATAYDTDLAIKDLALANKNDPNDKTVKTMLVKLREERAGQREKDKKTFTGMFDRGEIYDGKSQSSSSTGAPDETLAEVQDRVDNMKDDDSLEKRIQDAEMLRDLYMRNGKEDEAKKLNEQIQQGKKALKNQKAGRTGLDFKNPTGDMIKDAEKYGIDLKDPLVQQELERLEAERAGKDGKGGPRGGAAGSFPGDSDAPAKPTPWWRYFIFFSVVGTLWRIFDSGLIGTLWGKMFAPGNSGGDDTWQDEF